MKPILKLIFTMLVLQFFYSSTIAQIIINGRVPGKLNNGPGVTNALTVSYGNVIWVDGKNVPLAGYSAPLAFYHTNSVSSIENYNASYGLNIGYERQLADYFAVRLSFSTARLINGITSRSDLITNDQSKITQLGIYSRYSLTKNLKHRIQVQWLAGPELMYVKKDVLINEYVADENATPQQYHQNITITEGAVVTGIGASLRLSKNFAFFSDFLGGISLPGKGLKFTNSGLGLKVSW